jgi:hypothetical protein
MELHTHTRDIGRSSIWYLLKYRSKAHKNESLRLLWHAYENLPKDQFYFIYHDDGAL